MGNSLITEVDILDESRECFLVYADEVLTDRAIPDISDGLLSAQRKILWTMEDYLKMDHNSKTKKCNAIVGSTLATSYYHGDASCYGVLCKLSQKYLMRYPLIHPQGNLGTQEDNDLVASSRYCVAGDTLIATSEGTQRIKDIVPNSEDDTEYDIDLKVQGGFGEKRHASKFFNTGIRDILKIELRNGQWIKVTKNHPLLTMDEELNLVWKLAGDLTESDKLLISYNTNNSCFGSNNDLLEAKMLGAMISEGYATTQNRIGINNKDIEMIIPVRDFIQRELKENQANINYNETRQYYEYCIADKKFYPAFIDKYEFERSDGKHLPQSFWLGTKQYQSNCLSYLFEGDGSVDVNYGISYSSISEELIHQLQIVLLQNFGILSTIQRSSTRREIKLKINNISARAFMEQINFVSERKRNRLADLVQKFESRPTVANGNFGAIHEVTKYVRNHHLPGHSVKVQNTGFNNKKNIGKAKEHLTKEDYEKAKNIIDNYYYLPIKSITSCEPEIAYSIRIDDDTHSFIGNGFINHNTEAKPSTYADLMFQDFKKKVVPMKETYNGEFMEPVILPSLFPNALCNGRQSIGVSMAHSSPPHNLTEVCDAAIALIKQGTLSIDELLSYIPGPDFPLGGTVLNISDIREAFETGKSAVSLKVRGDYEVKGQKITFTTIPYRTYRNKIKEQIEKNVDILSEYIEDFDDESNIGDNKLVFHIKKGASVDEALEQLFNLTDLQTTISYNMNYIVNGTPKLCSMLDVLKNYILHQEEVLIKATEYDKEKAESRIHILEGLIKAVDKINEVIKLIKESSDKNDARNKLINFLEIDEIQANAILDMKLGKLTRIDKQELIKELEEKREFVAKCIEILTNKETRNNVLIEKITWLRDNYGDERRTKLLNINIEKPTKTKEKKVENCAITISKIGLVKRSSKSPDTTTADSLFVFSNKGKMYRTVIEAIPPAGKRIEELTKMPENERSLEYLLSNNPTNEDYILFITKRGIVKRVPIDQYTSAKRTGVSTIKLKEGDELASVIKIKDTGKEEITLLTKRNKAIRFKLAEMPVSSRIAQGVKGITLEEGDEVVGGGLGNKVVIFGREKEINTKLRKRGSKGLEISG